MLQFLNNFKVETSLVERIEKTFLFYFEHYDFRNTKEVGSKKWWRNKYTS